MGSVGSIEKVMVGGILAIILLILGVAIRGNADISSIPLADGKGVAPNVYPEDDEVSERRSEIVDPDPVGGSPHLRKDIEREASETDSVPDVTNTNEPIIVPPRNDPPTRPVVAQRPMERTYTVKSGDSFERIAVNEYGNRSFVSELQKANEDVDPRRLRIGQKINLPDLTALSNQPTNAPVTSEPAPKSDAGVSTHIVAKGETLISISRKYYKTASQWKEILKANSSILSRPEQLRPGMELKIP